jgi:signal transduction histidine kinase
MVSTLLRESVDEVVLNEICPFFILVNAEGEIISLGKSLQKLTGTLEEGVSFDWFFEVLMPSSSQSADLFKIKGLMVVRLKRLLLDLKLNPIKLNRNLLLLGHPIINESFSFEKFGLTIGDLAKHDASIEYLFLHQAMRRSMLEADDYNAQLNKTNEQLSRALAEVSADHQRQLLRTEFVSAVFQSKSPEEICDVINSKCSSFLGGVEVKTFVYGWNADNTLNPDSGPCLSMPMVEVSENTTGATPFHHCAKQHSGSSDCSNCRAEAVYSSTFPITTGNETVEGCIYIGKNLKDDGTQHELAFVEELAKLAAVRLSELRTEFKLKHLNEELNTQVEEKTRELKENIKNLEMFAYSVSHDLKAPLRHVFSFSSLLRDRIQDQIDETSKQYLQTVMSASQKMSSLIDALLRFSRVGTVAINKIMLDPAQMIEEIIADKRVLNPHLTIETEIDAKFSISADRILIYQVFENLISNAIKYSSKRPVIKIKIVAVADKKTATFSISDNGIGFNNAYAQKLFKPFQRLHGSEEYEGTGIGLANVRRIVERHGGEINAHGEPGKGATFTFSLPHINTEL